MTTEELVGQVEEAELADDAALLLTGTGMFTFAALERLGAGNDRVLLTSNVCSARWARKQVASPAGSTPDLWPLRRLAKQAGRGA